MCVAQRNLLGQWGRERGRLTGASGGAATRPFHWKHPVRERGEEGKTGWSCDTPKVSAGRSSLGQRVTKLVCVANSGVQVEKHAPLAEWSEEVRKWCNAPVRLCNLSGHRLDTHNEAQALSQSPETFCLEQGVHTCAQKQPVTTHTIPGRQPTRSRSKQERHRCTHRCGSHRSQDLNHTNGVLVYCRFPGSMSVHGRQACSDLSHTCTQVKLRHPKHTWTFDSHLGSGKTCNPGL